MTEIQAHEKYSNDVIQEAIFELRLKTNEEITWDSKMTGRIYAALGIDDFPGMEPVSQFGFEFKVGESGQPEQRLIHNPPITRFSNEDSTKMVQVSPVLFSYNAVRSYPGWETMQTEMLRHWAVLSEIVAPASVARIGLRYINRIPLGDFPISHWLKANDYLPNGILSSQIGSKYRVERHIQRGSRIDVGLITSLDENSDVIIFDIDRLEDYEGLPTNNELLSITRTLHEEVWTVFDSSKTDNLERFMNEEDA